MIKKKDTKKIIGCAEIITLKGTNSSKKVAALIDTGATYTSVDKKIAEDIGFEKILRYVKIKLKASENDFIRRPMINLNIELKNKIFDTEVNITDRSSMTFPVIIGRNILFNNFIVDVEKNNTSFKVDEFKEKFKNKIEDELNGK